jgi:hypothetical protein
VLSVLAARDSGVLFDAEDMQKALVVMREVFLNIRNRRFFTSKEGYIGITSPGTLPGDKVCIFLGGNTPFIVRETSSPMTEEGRRFLLLSEAYVHGLIDGEGLGMREVEEDNIGLAT